MVVFDYFDNILSGMEFLIALGSIIGLLGLLVGLIFLIWGSSRMRGKMLGVIIVSFLLLAICGFSTGVKYFRLF
ncbi:MAG: hypothetical protein EAX89_15600 [Candidatus Lokiarchaeota archaeon]|nr:hypothetical protein [Candidatus Lokiarchaeota archaeon]